MSIGIENTFHLKYKQENQIGSGAFAVVSRATHRVTNKTVAVKCIPRTLLSDSAEASFMDEINIMKSLDHPNIIKYIDFFKEPDVFYLCLEYAPGGELFERIVLREQYSEDIARLCVRNICLGLKHCHDHNVVHRDIKPENILLMDDEDDTNSRIADFGLAARVPGDASTLTNTCGTAGYAAPETFELKPYGKSVDMFALGAVAFGLIGGYPPFDGDTDEEIIELSRRGSFQFDSPYWDEVSTEGKSFISRLLSVRPSDRLTADQALEHAWLQMHSSSLQERDITKNIEKLKTHPARRQLRVALTTALAVEKFKKLRNPPSTSSTHSPSSASSGALSPLKSPRETSPRFLSPRLLSPRQKTAREQFFNEDDPDWDMSPCTSSKTIVQSPRPGGSTHLSHDSYDHTLPNVSPCSHGHKWVEREVGKLSMSTHNEGDLSPPPLNSLDGMLSSKKSGDNKKKSRRRDREAIAAVPVGFEVTTSPLGEYDYHDNPTSTNHSPRAGTEIRTTTGKHSKAEKGSETALHLPSLGGR